MEIDSKYMEVERDEISGKIVFERAFLSKGSPGELSDGDRRLLNYRFVKTLGMGAFGKVKLAKHMVTNTDVAIKIINILKVKRERMEEKVKTEIKILRLQLQHPHIIRLYEVFQNDTNIYVVMEYSKSGELFEYILLHGRLVEDDARRMFQQIICGVQYCHRNMVAHRDLKPENLLLDPDGNVKIADFGLSNIMRDGHFLKTSCGSPNYAAPEVVSGLEYVGHEVDVWSCGVILYALLCGSLPFDVSGNEQDNDIPSLFRKIKGGIYTLSETLPKGPSDLIVRMLKIDPIKRITIPEILKHKWVSEKIPRYLAVPNPDPGHQTWTIDPDVVKETVEKGFSRGHLLESLMKKITNDATVAYHLILDSQRTKVTSGYLSGPLESSSCGREGYFQNGRNAPRRVRKVGVLGLFRRPMAPVIPPSTHHFHRASSNIYRSLAGSTRQWVENNGHWENGAHSEMINSCNSKGNDHNKWLEQDVRRVEKNGHETYSLPGIHSQAFPGTIMIDVIRVLLRLGVVYKKGRNQYNINCRWASWPRDSGRARGLQGPSWMDFESQVEHEKYYGKIVVNVVKFELQLYQQIESHEYVLDLQRTEGTCILYLDFCHQFFSALHIFG